MKPMLVGLNNPYSVRESDALLHYPRNATGARILKMIRDVDDSFTADEYLEAFDRMNLWPGLELPTGPGSMALYQSQGRALLRKLEAEPRDVVLFGERVWWATLGRNVPEKFSFVERGGCRFFYLPHPSPRNFIYNKPANRTAAGRVLLQLARQKSRRRRVA